MLEEVYEKLSLKLEAIFFQYDPIGINLGSNIDEYSFEVAMVLSQLPLLKSEEEVHAIVYESFCTLFDVDIAGEKQSEEYKNIAKETWEVWCEYLLQSSKEENTL